MLDFGAARYAIGDQSRSLSVILKAGYAPEEQYRSKGVQGPWTDIYATAATFYRALTGNVPPEALDRMHEDQIETPSSLGVSIPPAAEAALLKALSVLGAKRFQTMREFRESVLNASPGAQKVFTPPVQPVIPPGVESTVPLGKAGQPGPAYPTGIPSKPPVIDSTRPLEKADTPPVSGGGPLLPKGPAGEQSPAAPLPPDLQKTTPLAKNAAPAMPAGAVPAFTAAPAGTGGPSFGAGASYGQAPSYTEPLAAGAAALSAGAYVSAPSVPGPAAARSKKKPLIAIGGVFLLIALLVAGGFAVYQMTGGTGAAKQAQAVTHGILNSDQKVILKNNIKGISICKAVNETTLEPVEPVQEYLSSQTRYNAVVRTAQSLKEKITGNWYYLGSGQRQLVFTFDITGTGTEDLVWFWCEPAPPALEGPWEFEAVMANGATKSSAFNVVHDPALDVAEPDYSNNINNYDIYYEPEINVQAIETIDEPIEENYDYTQ